MANLPPNNIAPDELPPRQRMGGERIAGDPPIDERPLADRPFSELPPGTPYPPRPANSDAPLRRPAGKRHNVVIGVLVAVIAIVAVIYVIGAASHPDNPAQDVSPAEVQNADPSTDVAPPATPPAGTNQ
jgi:hypothetical protein